MSTDEYWMRIAIEEANLAMDNNEIPVSEFVDALDEIKAEGLINNIGASNCFAQIRTRINWRSWLDIFSPIFPFLLCSRRRLGK